MNSREFRYVIFTLTTHKLCTEFFFSSIDALCVLCSHRMEARYVAALKHSVAFGTSGCFLFLEVVYLRCT
jgi:hypothetical protein